MVLGTVQQRDLAGAVSKARAPYLPLVLLFPRK